MILLLFILLSTNIKIDDELFNIKINLNYNKDTLNQKIFIYYNSEKDIYIINPDDVVNFDYVEKNKIQVRIDFPIPYDPLFKPDFIKLIKIKMKENYIINIKTPLYIIDENFQYKFSFAYFYKEDFESVINFKELIEIHHREYELKRRFYHFTKNISFIEK